MIYEFFRWFALITGYPIWFLFFKPKVYYKNKKRQSRRIKGGALIISNHYSVVDFILTMGLVFPRKLFVVTSEIAYNNKFFAFGMRFFGGIKVDRTTKSLRFIDESAALIEKGRVVQIFPEGHINENGELNPFKPTYLMIALKANRPIIPVVVDGNYGVFKRSHVMIGEPIYLSELEFDDLPAKERFEAMNEAVYQEVLSLKTALEKKKEGSD